MLRLNGLLPLDENVALLKSHITAAASRAFDVVLCYPSVSLDEPTFRTEMERSVMSLYSAAAEVDLQSKIDIIPSFSQLESNSCSQLRRDHFFSSKQERRLAFHPSYSYVAVGGTFDRLHGGHKLLLTVSAFHTVDLLRVGIAGPELLGRKKYADLLQSFDDRQAAILCFMTKLRPDLKLEIEMINEFSGGTDRIEGVEALVASPETLPAVPKINELRSQRGLKPIISIPIDFVGGKQPSISSTKLRELDFGRS